MANRPQALYMLLDRYIVRTMNSSILSGPKGDTNPADKNAGRGVAEGGGGVAGGKG